MAGKEKPSRGSKGLQGVATMSLEAPALLNMVRVSTFQPYGCQFFPKTIESHESPLGQLARSISRRVHLDVLYRNNGILKSRLVGYL
jgi:hypothetical protein